MCCLLKNQQQGFSLLELVTVLLIISVLSTIAIRSTVDIGYSVRFEQTRDRLESIRKAIVGDPTRSINGQPDVSGFVVDMGRLPDNIRELVQSFVCINTSTNIVTGDTPSQCVDVNEVPTYLDVPCSDNVQTDKVSCEALTPPNDTWVGKTLNTTSGLNFGWIGSYLNMSNNPDNTDAYTDGWGNQSPDENYGWNIQIDTPNPSDLTIQSKGKDGDSIGDDGSNCGIDFDKDCNTLIYKNDYITEVSSIFVMFQKKLANGIVTIPPVSFCTDPSTANNLNRMTCELNGFSWFGGCDVQGYFNKADCENASLGNSTWNACSDTISSDEPICVNASGVWYGNTGYDTDTWTKRYTPATYPQRSICMSISYKNPLTLEVTYTSSDPVMVTENGTYQTFHFTGFKDSGDFDGDSNTSEPITDITIGAVSVGVYEYTDTNGNTIFCEPEDDAFYPSDRTEPIKVLFAPHRDLHVINW